MSLSAAIAANVIFDVAILAVLAWVMSRPARMRPHASLHDLGFATVSAVRRAEDSLQDVGHSQAREAA